MRAGIVVSALLAAGTALEGPSSSALSVATPEVSRIGCTDFQLRGFVAMNASSGLATRHPSRYQYPTNCMPTTRKLTLDRWNNTSVYYKFAWFDVLSGVSQRLEAQCMCPTRPDNSSPSQFSTSESDEGQRLDLAYPWEFWIRQCRRIRIATIHITHATPRKGLPTQSKLKIASKARVQTRQAGNVSYSTCLEKISMC